MIASIRCRRTDERGMILVIALPMAALAIGCLWYVVSVGDAILHRERLQDAADATAFESAVLHARAMNAEVSLNLLWAGLHAMRSALPAAASLGATELALQATGPQLLSSVRALSPRVETALLVVQGTALALRAQAPLLATAEATRINSARYARWGAADGAIALSYAALPRQTQAGLAPDPLRPWLLQARGSAADAQPLPVAERGQPQLPLVAADELLGRGPLSISTRASNGNAVLQTWSIARSAELVRQRADERGMSLASPGRPVSLAPSHTAYAQAEFYFDCAQPWPRCAPDAAWSPRWTARLRRFERPDAAPSDARRLEQAFTRASVALDAALRAGRAVDGPRVSSTRGDAARTYIRELFRGPVCGGAPCLH